MRDHLIGQSKRILLTGASGFIGTRLIKEFVVNNPDAEIRNVDICPPTDPEQSQHWVHANILDVRELERVIGDFRPTHVVHLAAQVGGSEELGDGTTYPVNIEGTQNLVRVLRTITEVRRLVITSTAFVCRPGHVPQNDTDYSPHTAYGRSKVKAEEAVRKADLRFTWTIVRPGTIWGPGVRRQHYLMLRFMDRGLYMHPGRQSVRRPFGFVGNVVFQIRRLLELPVEAVHRKTFYVCDPPVILLDWVNLCSIKLLGRPPRVMPRPIFWCVAAAGDVLQKFGKRSVLTRFRYRSMIEDYVVPVERTLELTGKQPFSIEQGIEEFVSWYKADQGGDAFHVRPWTVLNKVHPGRDGGS